MAITFDPTITIGNVIETTTIVGGGLLVLVRMQIKIALIDSKMGSMGEQMALMRSAFDKIGDVLMQLAIQKKDIEVLRERVRDLSHGRGFVQAAIREWPQRDIVPEET